MIKKIILDNGLTVILNRNKKINKTIASVFVKSGAFDIKFNVDNKKIEVPYGTAHFLEHYLIEQSRNGNIGEYLSKEYVEYNGLTGSYRTEFYISTVHDFNKYFRLLLDYVNNPVFEDERVKKVIKPIVAELNRKNDGKKLKYLETVFDSVFTNKVFNIGLGCVHDIENMSADTLEKFYKAHYYPANEVIVITGNFDMDVLDIIKEKYKDIKNVNLVKEKIIENDNVNKEVVEFYDNEKNESVTLGIKVNINKYSPLDKNKIDYYMTYYLEYVMGDKSKLFIKLLKNHKTNFSFNYFHDMEFLKGYMFIMCEIVTKDFDYVVHLLKEELYNVKLSKDSFEKWKKKLLISFINREENPFFITDSLINNYFLFDYFYSDSIDFIKSLDYKECCKMIKELDLSNYSIIMKKERK